MRAAHAEWSRLGDEQVSKGRPPMRGLSIERLAIAGVVFAAAAVLGLAALTWNFTRGILAASTFVAHTQEVMSAIGSAEALLFRAESAQRAWLASLQPLL